METITENVRYLLWRADIAQTAWAARLAQWAKCEMPRAQEILQGAALRPSERSGIVHATHCAEEEFHHARLAEGVDIVRENFRFLITGLEHGKEQHLATHLKVSPVTVSRWASGRQRPHRTVFPAVCRYFELPEGTDLENNALFLLPYPDTESRRRAWLRRQIEQLSPGTLRALFPALQRLLKDA
jgi:transcriptional regulator with XRE-family HTH domain